MGRQGGKRKKIRAEGGMANEEKEEEDRKIKKHHIKRR